MPVHIEKVPNYTFFLHVVFKFDNTSLASSQVLLFFWNLFLSLLKPKTFLTEASCMSRVSCIEYVCHFHGRFENILQNLQKPPLF